MSYLSSFSLRELAEHYKKYSDSEALVELDERDRFSKMSYDEIMASRLNETPDQMSFEFEKVKNVDYGSSWSDAYELGFIAGIKTERKRSDCSQYFEADEGT